MKINILEKLTLSGHVAWSKALVVTPIILFGIVMLIWGILASDNPKIANVGLEVTGIAITILPIGYFLIFFKWFKI